MTTSHDGIAVLDILDPALRADSPVAQHPEQWRLLATRPELASAAVEEVMRVNPTIPVIARVATEDFTFQDVHIPTGTHIALFVSAAHTDPAIFGDTPFDITAARAPQLTFGGGIHHCLGVSLARTEMREALPILASRLGAITLAGPVPSRRTLGRFGRGRVVRRARLLCRAGTRAGGSGCRRWR
jgi:cytochrome P450